ncbi:MAG TPA: sulfotransferase [Rhizomicrobium sp.]|nr:sulfotransferase [Rhizomicrobium sp.]
MIFIFSSARSGSTWLAKAFDSHPDTIYLHEPDIADRGDDLLPYWFAHTSQGYESRAKAYLSRLRANRNLRTVGTRPFFPKTYRGLIERGARTGLIYLGKGLEKAGFPATAEKIGIPDWSQPASPPKIVIKSVSALGRAEALVRSGADITPILLLRHPCGYVHSYMRGNRMGVMPPPRPLGELLETRSAHRLGAARAVSSAGGLVETLAWDWLLANCEAYPAISERGVVLRYEDLAQNPEAQLRALFSKLGLAWSDSTTQFLKACSTGDGSYYSLARNPVAAANRWKSQLDPKHIEQIRNIVCRDPIGERYFG